MSTIRRFSLGFYQVVLSTLGSWPHVATHARHNSRRAWVGVFVCSICFMAGTASSQSPPGSVMSSTSPVSDTLESSQVWTANLAYEPVGAGDLLYVSVSGSPELSRSYRVSAEGRLLLPLLDEGILVAGLIPTSISHAVSQELVRQRILVDPIVSIAVLEYRSRLVSVVGAVKVPGTMQAVGDFKLLDAIARTQGISPEAGPEIIVSRLGAASDSNQTVHLPIKELLQGKDLSLNIALHGGEVIRVPEAPKLYIVGNVKQPGTYPLTESEGSTVLKALALSQGTLPYTAREAYIYRLVPGSTNRQELRVGLRKILHRQSPDVQLLANDILYIPDNSALRLNASVLDHIAGFAGSTASGLIIWH
jgi:polysaccharide biosynthesis/export protein